MSFDVSHFRFMKRDMDINIASSWKLSFVLSHNQLVKQIMMMKMKRVHRMNSQCSDVDLILIKRFDSISKIEKKGGQDDVLEMLLMGKLILMFICGGLELKGDF